MHSHPKKYWLDYTNLMESDQARRPERPVACMNRLYSLNPHKPPCFSERSLSAIFRAIRGALPPARLLLAIALEYMNILGGLAIRLQKQAINCIGNYEICWGDSILGIQGTLAHFRHFLYLPSE